MSSKFPPLVLSIRMIIHSAGSPVQSQEVAAGKPASQPPDVIPAQTARPSTSADRLLRPLPRGKGRGTNFRRAPSPTPLPPLPPRPRWPGEDERKQQFLDDPDVEKIELRPLLCRHCSCWIRLNPIIRYTQSVWPRHKASCKYIQLIVCVFSSVLLLSCFVTNLVVPPGSSEAGAGINTRT
jgi:hypothetical protein